MNETEMIRGCLLLTIESHPGIHGYNILRVLEQLDFNEVGARIYRMLRGLEKDGLVSSEFGPSANGPRRRNYEITDKGRARVLQFDNMLDYDIARLTRLKGSTRAVIGAR